MEFIHFLEYMGPINIIGWAAVLFLTVLMIRTMRRHYSRTDLAPERCRSCGNIITAHVCKFCGRDQTSFQ